MCELVPAIDVRFVAALLSTPLAKGRSSWKEVLSEVEVADRVFRPNPGECVAALSELADYATESFVIGAGARGVPEETHDFPRHGAGILK